MQKVGFGADKMCRLTPTILNGGFPSVSVAYACSQTPSDRHLYKGDKSTDLTDNLESGSCFNRVGDYSFVQKKVSASPTLFKMGAFRSPPYPFGQTSLQW